MFVFRPLLAFFFFSSLAAVESSSSVSSPRDALVVFQNVIHSAANVQDVHRPTMMEEDRKLLENISETCLNESVAALGAFDLGDATDITYYEEATSACTSSVNSVQCDFSQFPGFNDAVETACTAGGYALVEVTLVVSVDSMRMEFNNMGFCVGSSCSTEEVGDFFGGLSELFGELLSLGGDNTTLTSDMSISFTLEEDMSSSSSPHRTWSSFAGGAIAASVGLMFLF